MSDRPTALDVSAAIIEAHNEKYGPITLDKLQALLYYCQGWHLAWYDEPMFDDPIEAWPE